MGDFLKVKAREKKKKITCYTDAVQLHILGNDKCNIDKRYKAISSQSVCFCKRFKNSAVSLSAMT